MTAFGTTYRLTWLGYAWWKHRGHNKPLPPFAGEGWDGGAATKTAFANAHTFFSATPAVQRTNGTATPFADSEQPVTEAAF